MSNKTTDKAQGINKGMIATIVVIGVLFFSVIWSIDGPQKLLNSILAANPFWLVIAISLFIGAWLAEIMVLHELVRGLVKPNYVLKQSIGLGIIGKLFDNITPMSTGGQPVQIWRMSHQEGISVGGASSVMLLKFIIFQVVVTIYSIIAFAVGYNFFNNVRLGFGAMVIIGVVINTTVMLALIAIIFTPKLIRYLSGRLIGFLSKFRLIKNHDATLERINRELDAFYVSSNLIFKNQAVLWRAVLWTIIQIGLFHLVAYVVFVALGGRIEQIGWAFLASVFIWIATAFIPLPGASIGVEAAFYMFFAVVYQDGIAIGLAMMVWRIITYYLPIVIGMIFYLNEKRRKIKQVF